MPGDVQLTALQTEAAPLDYVVPLSAVVRVKSVRAEFTDNGALADWLPAVQLVSDSGHIIATASDQGAKVTAGGDADASFFPGAAKAAQTSSGTVTYPACAIMDNSGASPQSVPTNTRTIADFAGGAFGTNDATTFSLVADTWGSGVTSLSIHKPGEYRLEAGCSGFGGGGAGWTAALAASTLLGIEMLDNSPNMDYDYVFNNPDGGFGWDDPFGGGSFWWSSKTVFTATVSADIGSRPVLVAVEQKGGHTMDLYASLLATQLSATGF